jgi:membrane protease YdiL (CAAX protease family)
VSSSENPFLGQQPPTDGSASIEPAAIQRELPPEAIDAGIVERFPVWGFFDLGLVLAVLAGAMVASQVIALLVATTLPAFHGLKLQDVATSPLVALSSMAAGYFLTLLFVYRMLASHYRVGFFDGMHWRWPAKWPIYLASGVVLSIAVQGASAFLPMPKDLPIDAFFKNAAGAWAMALFGTFVAPFAEEVLFRGLLFPVLQRRLGLLLSVLLTGGTFALVHAGQLGHAWAPVLMLLIVGVALTLIRARAHSLAASVLVHTAYNATIFAIVASQTHWFTQMNRLH